MKKKHTFVVNEDITIKTVPKQQDVIGVFEIDVCSGEKMGVETAERKGRCQTTVIPCYTSQGKKHHGVSRKKI